MRIWHQSFTVLEDVPAYTARVRRHIDRVKRPGTAVELHGLARATYPADYPGDDLGFNVLFGMHANQWAANALIIDGLGATIKMAEAMVEMKAAIGLSHTRHGFFTAA